MSKKVGVVVLLALFALSFVGSFVSAETVFEHVFSGSAGFADLFSGAVNSNAFIQFLLFVLVAIIVYSIAEFLPFVGQKGWVASILSIVVAILATFYLDSVEVKSILISYSTLGIVLTVVVPFFAVAAIAKKSHEKGYPFLGKLMWAAFIAILAVKVFSAPYGEVKMFSLLVYGIFGVIALIMLIFDNVIFMQIFKQTVRGNLKQADELNIARLEARRNKLQDDLSSLPSDSPEYQKLQANIKDLGRQIKYLSRP